MKIVKMIVFLVWGLQLIAQSTASYENIQNLLKAGKADQAKAVLEKIISEDENQAQAHYYLGIIYLIKGRYEPAIEALDHAIELNKTDYRFYERLGDAYGLKAQKGGMLKAIWAIGDMRENWEKAIELKPDLVSARERLFSYYLVAPGIAGGDEDKAFNLAQEVLHLKPASGHMLLAQYYHKTGSAEKAEAAIQQAASLDSLNGNLMNQIGYFYINQNQPQKALKWMDRYVQLEPDNPNAWDSRGDCFMKSETYDSALVMYDAALKRQPDFEASLFHKGLSLKKIGRSADANLAFERYLELYPQGQYAETVKENQVQ